MRQHHPMPTRQATFRDEQVWQELVTRCGDLLRPVAHGYLLSQEQVADAVHLTSRGFPDAPRPCRNDSCRSPPDGRSMRVTHRT